MRGPIHERALFCSSVWTAAHVICAISVYSVAMSQKNRKHPSLWTREGTKMESPFVPLPNWFSDFRSFLNHRLEFSCIEYASWISGTHVWYVLISTRGRKMKNTASIIWN